MKPARTVAPVGYWVPLTDIVAACVPKPSRYRETFFEPDFARALEVRTALAVSSGKAALTLTLLALASLSGRRKVIIPAYTCYSLPSAIVKARLEVVPCDLAEGSFDYDYSRLGVLLTDEVLCVVSVHLFGIPSDTARLRQLCDGTGIFVVEDAAQALTGAGHRRPGTTGDVGVFSLGRGKNITCGSGGVIVTDSKEIAAALAQVTKDLPKAPLMHDVVTLVTLLFLSLFILPWLYWLPVGLPFLRLGETIFHDDFPVHWLSDFQARLLRRWRRRLDELEAVRRDHTGHYLAHIEALRNPTRMPSVLADRELQPVRVAAATALLRFPILLASDRDKDRILVARDGVAVGMSGMYPATVAAIPQLRGMLSETSFPRAERVAGCLVTLPTHPLVMAADRARLCELMNETLRHRQEERMVS